MAILGYDTKGANTGAISTAGTLAVSKFTLASPLTLTELHGWFSAGASSGQSVRIVVYAADGTSGAPGTRLAYTGSLAFPTTAGDYHLSETGLSVALTSGDYWIGFICTGGTSGSAYREDTGGTHRVVTGATYTPPPTPYPGGGSSGTRKYSCWGVVSAAAATFVPQIVIA